MATIISLINQKGGCAKSTTAFSLGGTFAVAGMHTLVIDADPQGSLSQGFFGSTKIENLALHETLAALFDDGAFVSDSASLIVPTDFDRISIVRANQSLAPHNLPEPERLGLKQFVLREFVQSIADLFDIVVIDCPPNIYQCSWSALVAADYVVIPLTAEDYGAQGLRVVHEAIDNARLLNPDLKLLGHLVTRFDARLLVHRSYQAMLRSLYGDSIFTTVIPEASAFKVALACRQPVSHYSPASRAAQITADLGREILDRVAGRPELRRSA
jgi:chromosome partitioning protein